MGKLQLAGRIRGAIRTVAPVGLNISQSQGPPFEPVRRDGLTARCHRDWPDDPLFLTQWDELLAGNPWATVFRCAAWQSAVVDEFVPAGQFRLITVDCRGQLLAVVPLALTTASMLETPGKWVSDYLDPQIDADHSRACWSIILEMLDKLWDWSIGCVSLPNIRGESSLRTILPSLAPKWNFLYHEVMTEKAPYIPLPKTWDEYWRCLAPTSVNR